MSSSHVVLIFARFAEHRTHWNSSHAVRPVSTRDLDSAELYALLSGQVIAIHGELSLLRLRKRC